MEELLPSQSVVTSDKDGLYPSWRCIPEEGFLENGDDLNEKKQGIWCFNIGASTAISNKPTTGEDMGVLESRYIYIGYFLEQQYRLMLYSSGFREQIRLFISVFLQ